MCPIRNEDGGKTSGKPSMPVLSRTTVTTSRARSPRLATRAGLLVARSHSAADRFDRPEWARLYRTQGLRGAHTQRWTWPGWTSTSGATRSLPSRRSWAIPDPTFLSARRGRARPWRRVTGHTSFPENDRKADYHTQQRVIPIPERFFLLYVVRAADRGGGESKLRDIQVIKQQLEQTAAGRAVILTQANLPQRSSKRCG